MKNKGRRHKWYGNPEEVVGIANCKGMISHITRPIGLGLCDVVAFKARQFNTPPKLNRITTAQF